MSPFRSWYVDLVRQLALRLERLEESLAAFKDRLRIVLADAIGRFVGDGIRDAVDGVFTALSGRSPDALGAPVGYAASPMDFGDGDGILLDSREACVSYRSDSAPGISCARSSQAKASRSLLGCVASILRTSIVWAPFRGRPWGWRTRVTLAVCVGGLAVLAPSLSDVVLGLFASLLPLPTLTEAIRAVGMS
jgi:hypothetical protein